MDDFTLKLEPCGLPQSRLLRSYYQQPESCHLDYPGLRSIRKMLALLKRIWHCLVADGNKSKTPRLEYDDGKEEEIKSTRSVSTTTTMIEEDDWSVSSIMGDKRGSAAGSTPETKVRRSRFSSKAASWPFTCFLRSLLGTEEKRLAAHDFVKTNTQKRFTVGNLFCPAWKGVENNQTSEYPQCIMYESLHLSTYLRFARFVAQVIPHGFKLSMRPETLCV